MKRRYSLYIFLITGSFLCTSFRASGQEYIPIEKTFNASVAYRGDWDWYKEPSQQTKLGKLTNGESVEIVGWVPWMVAIKRDKLVGFVTYTCFESQKELTQLVEIIEMQSGRVSVENINDFAKWGEILLLNEAALSKNLIDGRKKDSLEFANEPNLLLRLSTSKNEIFEGECTVINLSFYVSSRNKQRLQFYNLAEDITEISKIFWKSGSWTPSAQVSEIKSTNVKIARTDYQVYKVFESTFCPIDLTPIHLDKITLRFAKMKGKSDSIETVIPFSSKPLTINVKSIPPGVKLSKAEFHKPCGIFLAKESLQQSVSQRALYHYKVKLYSTGLTFPLVAPNWQHPDLSICLRKETDSDTTINGQYYSSKTFEYSIAFLKQGNYNLSKNILTYFNLKTLKSDSIIAGPKVQATAEMASEAVCEESVFRKKGVLIAFDVSQSMLIEDYPTNRLAFLNGGLLKFLSSQKSCDVGLIAFAGEAKRIFEITPCSNKYSSLTEINSKSLRNGTAIGEAILLASKSFTSQRLNPRILILIGDGDNTAGMVSPELAIKFAKKNQIKVYSIGIGHKGLVPFGKNSSGVPNMVDNTFSDETLRKISASTGGQYFWAEKEGDVEKFLSQILASNGY